MDHENASYRVDTILQDIGSDALRGVPGDMKPIDKNKDMVLEPRGEKLLCLISLLVKENQDLWDRFTNHTFVKKLAMADNASPLDQAFKDYLKQDYYYLVNLIRFRAARLAKFRSDANYHDLTAEFGKIKSAYTFANDFRQTCLGKEKVADQDQREPANPDWKPTWKDDDILQPVKSTEKELDDSNGPNVAVLGYNSFLQDRVSLDDWFTLYIANIPCIYGYAVIATNLVNTERYIKGTSFHKYWILVNCGYSSSNKLCAFIDANVKRYQSEATLSYWQNIFKTALKFEIALFDSISLSDKI